MKIAPLMFLAAAGLLTVAIAVPRRVEPPKQTLALDGDGIVALRVEGDARVEVNYTPACDCVEDDVDVRPKTPHVRWPSDGAGEVVVRREGDTLVLVATGLEKRKEIEVLPPRSVRRIDIPAGTVHSDEPLPAMTVRVREDFTWVAGADALEVVQTPTTACVANEYCTVQVRIGGDIGDLRVEAGLADVDLASPDLIRRAVVRLAPRSVLSVSNARRVDNVVVEYVDFDGAPLSADEAAKLRAEVLADDRESDDPAADAAAAAAEATR